MGKKNKKKNHQANENAEIQAIMSQATPAVPTPAPMEASQAAERTAALLSLDDEIAKARAT